MPDLGLEPGPQKIMARKDIMGQPGQVECGLGIRHLCCFNVKFPEFDTAQWYVGEWPCSWETCGEVCRGEGLHICN